MSCKLLTIAAAQLSPLSVQATEVRKGLPGRARSLRCRPVIGSPLLVTTIVTHVI